MKRLHKNSGGYHGATIDVRQVLRDVESSAQGNGWRREVFHSTQEFNWLALHRDHNPSNQARRIYISTGIHGDEPAGPLAALRLLQENFWPESAAITLLPCLNPGGFARNTRENVDGMDLNRDFLNPKSAEVQSHIRWLEAQRAFDLCLCLHEDWESNGFYVYELNADSKPSLAEGIVAAVERVCPIDHAEIIEGREAAGGIIRPNLDPRSRPAWPESFWLITHKTRLGYTLEAPSDFPLHTRVDALVAGVRAALQP